MTLADDIGIIGQQRKREIKMRNSTYNAYSGERKHTQMFTKKWSVWYKGEYRGTVKAFDKASAIGYISSTKYPERDRIELVPIVIEG